MVPYTGIEPLGYPPLKGRWYEKVFQMVLIVAVSWFFINAPTIFFLMMDLFKRNLSVILGQTLAVAITLSLGIFLYRFRSLHLGWYGVFECIFGFATALYVANNILLSASSENQSNNKIVLFFSWCGALYVIVRGLDNYHRSIIGTSREDQWRRLFFGGASARK